MEEFQRLETQLEAAQADPDLVGLYLAEISRIPTLSAQEEKVLAYRARDGELKAKERLVLSHLRLVVSVAREYGDTGLDFLDLVQEGNIGLLQAVDRFEIERGFRFSTYARWWIRQAIGGAIERQSQLIRIPAHLFRAVLRYQRLKGELSADDLAGREELIETTGLDAERLRVIERTVRELVSLDSSVGEGADGTLDEFISDTSISPPEREALRELLRDDLMRIMEQLPEREAEVLRRRFGLRGAPPQTLAEIGQQLGITRERVRQIEARALRHLKGAWGEKAVDYYKQLLND